MSQDKPTSVTLIPLTIRVECGATCRNRARLGLRYADRDGRSIMQVERCLAHANFALDLGVADGLIVLDNQGA